MGAEAAGAQPGGDGEDEGGVLPSTRQLHPQPSHYLRPVLL